MRDFLTIAGIMFTLLIADALANIETKGHNWQLELTIGLVVSTIGLIAHKTAK